MTPWLEQFHIPVQGLLRHPVRADFGMVRSFWGFEEIPVRFAVWAEERRPGATTFMEMFPRIPEAPQTLRAAPGCWISGEEKERTALSSGEMEKEFPRHLLPLSCFSYGGTARFGFGISACAGWEYPSTQLIPEVMDTFFSLCFHLFLAQDLIWCWGEASALRGQWWSRHWVPPQKPHKNCWKQFFYSKIQDPKDTDLNPCPVPSHSQSCAGFPDLPVPLPQVISHYQCKEQRDVHRFEKISNIIKQFKLSCRWAAPLSTGESRIVPEIPSLAPQQLEYCWNINH